MILLGFGGGASTFFLLQFILIILSSCATGLGYMVACLAGKPEIAGIVGPVVILPFLLFGGLFLNSDSAPSYFIWLQYLSPVKYGYEAMMVTFWETVDTIECPPTGDCQYPTGESVLKSFSFQDVSISLNIFILLALNLGFRTVAFLGLRRYIQKNQ